MVALYYGQVINISIGGVFLGGNTRCDTQEPSAATPTLSSDGIPDMFQLFDANGMAPANTPISYGDAVTIYNVSEQMWWKQTLGACLLDMDSSVPITPFTLSSSGKSGAIQVSPWGSKAANAIVMIQNDSRSGQNGDLLTLLMDNLIVATSSHQKTAILTFWVVSPATIERSVMVNSTMGPQGGNMAKGIERMSMAGRSGGGKGGNISTTTWILIGAGVLVLWWYLSSASGGKRSRRR